MKKWIFLLAGIAMGAIAFAQDAAGIEKAVNNKHYIFTAQTATSQGGRNIQLTGGYDLRVMGDSIAVALPYFGRAFVAPVNPADGGINFNTSNLQYAFNLTKKGNYEVSIKPTDVVNAREISMNISKNGYATVVVISNNRQPITFYGQVSALEQNSREVL